MKRAAWGRGCGAVIMTQSELIHFADCEIDVAGFALRRNGAVCDVEPQVLELLLYLARNPDRLLTKDDLIANVWHGRIVSDTTITSRIKSARQAIGDDGTQQKMIAAEAARDYLSGRSPFIHGAWGKPTFRATS